MVILTVLRFAFFSYFEKRKNSNDVKCSSMKVKKTKKYH